MTVLHEICRSARLKTFLLAMGSIHRHPVGATPNNRKYLERAVGAKTKKPWWNQGVTRGNQGVASEKETSVLGLRSVSVDTSTQATAETDGCTCSKHRKRSWYGGVTWYGGVIHTHIDALSRAIKGPCAEQAGRWGQAEICQRSSVEDGLADDGSS